MTAQTELMKRKKADRVVINVSGHKFVTSRKTLARFPTTKIGKLACAHKVEHFFDANEDIFREVLEYHRTGELHAPRNICFERFQSQLKFWGIDDVNLKECCQNYELSDSDLEKQFGWFERRYELKRAPNVKDKIWYFLTDPAGPYTKHRGAAMVWTLIYCTFTLIQTINMAIYTIPPADMNITTNGTAETAHERGDIIPDPCSSVRRHIGLTKYDVVWILEETLFIFFLLEILIRFSCCPNKRQFWYFTNTLDTIIIFIEATTIAVITIIWVFDLPLVYHTPCLATSVLIGLMTFAVQMRCMRLLAFATVFSRLRVLLLAIYNSKTEIGLLTTAVVMSSFIFGPTMYYTELIGTTFDQRTPNLQSVPTTYWWVIVTMTTVGYGDYFPTNILGYMCALAIMMLGLMVTALPVAIIGGNFTIIYKYNIKRERRLQLNEKTNPETGA